tara:strand:- start:183 stop:422 length:240 start_codon:yes stop_codon:yes gene_type:complete
LSIDNPRLTVARLLIVALPTYAVAGLTEKIFYIVPTIAMSLMVANAVESGSTSNRNRIEDEAGVADESDASDGIDGDIG